MRQRLEPCRAGSRAVAGADVGQRLESIPDTLAALSHSWLLLLLLLVYSACVLAAGFGFRDKVCYCSAVFRTVWRTSRVEWDTLRALADGRFSARGRAVQRWRDGERWTGEQSGMRLVVRSW